MAAGASAGWRQLLKLRSILVAVVLAGGGAASPAGYPGLILTEAAPPPLAGEGATRGVDSPVTPPTVPPDAKPPGEREPLIGLLAAVSIVVAAAAGIYVYRVIRKGL